MTSTEVTPAVPETPLASPVQTYLASLPSPHSRRSMRRSIEAIVELAAELAEEAGWQVQHDVEAFRWDQMTYSTAVVIRAALTGRWAPSTVNRHLAAARGVMRAAWLTGQIPREQAEVVREGLRSVRAERIPAGRLVTEGELRAVFATIAEHDTPGRRRDAALIGLLGGTGMRRAELVGLDLADWDPTTGELQVRHGKGNKQRLVYVRAGADAALRSWLQVRGDVPGPLLVAVGLDGRVDPALARLSTQSVYLRVLAWAQRAQVEPFTPHDLRRTVASSLLDRGVDVIVIAGLLGHSQITTTARYDRRPEQAKQRASELVYVPYVPMGSH